jgi:hypothetical protein
VTEKIGNQKSTTKTSYSCNHQRRRLAHGIIISH